MTETVVLFYAEGGASITHALLFGPSAPNGQGISLNEIAGAATGAVVFGVLYGEDVTTWRIALPDLPVSKLLQILPSQMEDRVALMGVSTHFAVFEPDTGAGALVAAVDAGVMTAASGAADALGVSLKALVPDYMLIPNADGIQAFSAPDNPKRWIVRNTDGSGLAAEPALVAEISPGVSPSTTLVYRADMFDVAATSNLLQGQFQPRFRAAAFLVLMRRAGVLLVLALFLWAANIYFSASQTNDDARRVTAQTADVFQKTFTNVGRIVDMEAQAEREVAIRRQNSGSAFLRISDIVFSAVRDIPGVIIDGLRFNEAQGAYFVTVSFTDFANGERFRNNLALQGLNVTEGSSRQEDGRVITDLAIEVAQ